MEILINELSLNGNFSNLEEFYESLNGSLRVQKMMDKCSIVLLRHQQLYTYKVTKDHTIFDAFKDRKTRENDEVRKFKSLLHNLMSDPPFWHENQKHNYTDSYICEFTSKTNDYSLAEACERDKIVLSFDNPLFHNASIEIAKNGTEIDLLNIYEPISFAEYLFEMSLIDSREFCNYRFEGSNLSFENLEDEYGFDILEEDEVKAFISTFKQFSEMSWENIQRSEGLDFKKYQPSSKKLDWFSASAHSDKQINKFRTSKKYRCFGYREKDVFYVLRFERDHSISDNG